MKSLEINEEFKKLIPSLTDEEYERLEQNLLNEGWRDNEYIIVWDGVIVDGHNRYKICKKHDISFNVFSKEFSSETDAKLWMINNQKGRRNLGFWQKYELFNVKRELLKQKGKENLKQPTGTKKGLTLSNVDKVNTQKELAEELGCSTGKLAQADVVNKEVDEETKQKLRKEETTVHKEYKKIRKKRRQEEIREERERIQELAPLSEEYDVIVIDPPWEYEGSSYDPEGNRAKTPYPTMTMQELKELNLPAKKDCVLWLWTTNAFMKRSYELLNAWGFQDKTILTWDKVNMGCGWWLRNKTEHCILAIRGEPRGVIFENKKYTTLLREKRTSHSSKPEGFYEMVDEVCYGKKLDYFSREEREGWDCYGTIKEEEGE